MAIRVRPGSIFQVGSWPSRSFSFGAGVDVSTICAIWRWCPIPAAGASPLILLRHKFCAYRVGLVMRVQHGHRDNRRMMAAATILRIVAMEFGM